MQESPIRGNRQPPASTTGKGRLFPYFVCRVAGLPVRYLEALRAAATSAACDELLAREAEMEAAQEELKEALFTGIGATDDRKQRGTLLRIKRDLHNLRLLRSSDLDRSEPLLPPELTEGLRRFRELGLERRRRLAEIGEIYLREVAAARRQFQAWVTDADFRKGLLLSSRTLLTELKRYTRAAVTNLGSKEKQIERGLMRYFSRMVMKATPFATFCAIVPGQFFSEHGDEGAEPVFAGDPQSKRSSVRLNKSLYAALLTHLLLRPSIRKHLHLELNPTLREENGKWVFLSAVKGREVFQRMARNPVLDLFRELFEEHPHLRLGSLLERLCSNPGVEATPEDAEQFVDRLLEIGFLRFRIGIPEQEVDWDVPFREILEAIEDDQAAEVSELLVRLRAAIEAYAAAPVEEREEVLDGASSLVKTSFESLEAKTRLMANIPFYEDAAGEGGLSLPRGEIAELADRLVEYVGLTSRLAWPRSEQASMRHFFDDFYGADRRAVPLLQFYEEYFREHFKAHLERQQQAMAGGRPRPQQEEAEAGAEAEAKEEQEEEEEAKQEYNVSNPFQLELTEGIRKANTRLTELIQARWREHPEAEEITLEREDLESVLAEVPEANGGCRSVSIFLQYLPGYGPNGRPAVVANSYLTGFGKYFSRFLYLVPAGVQSALFDNNLGLTDQLVAEICGDAGFNANLHPPLLRWELSYPTGESGASEDQLRSSDLDVERDPNDPHTLCLRHVPTGKRVIPVDLGFLNPRMRPPLYQLLARFSPASNYSLQIPESPRKPEKTDDEPKAAPSEDADRSAEITSRPRVSFRRDLVLARRTWRIPAAAFPARASNESESDYFLRIHRWRKDHGIPSEVFLRVRPLPVAGKPPPKDEEAQRPEEKAEEGTPVAETGEIRQAEGDEDQNPPPEDKPAEPGPAGRRVRAHGYKPQYVDFSNPLLVELFSKAAENLKNFVVSLEERLPARQHLVRRSGDGGDGFVTELIVQVDFGDDGRASGKREERGERVA